MAALPLFASFLPNTASFVPPRSSGGATLPPAASATTATPDARAAIAFAAAPALTPTSLLSGRAARHVDPARAGSPPVGAVPARRRATSLAGARVDSSTGSLFADLPDPPRGALPSVARIAAPAGDPAVVPRELPSSPPPSPEAVPAVDAATTPAADAARSPIDRTEAALREAGLAGRFWRGNALSVSPLPSTPSGFRLLDEQLPGGGWPSRCLTELLLSHTGVGEIRFLASTLSSLTQAGRQIVLLAPPHIPDPTGWEQLGIDMRRVLIVEAAKPTDRLWAIEESLRSSTFGALLAWLPEEKTLARHDALRRLQSAAASADGLTFLFRPAAAQDHASPAPLRLALSTGIPDGPRRLLSVRLLKRRGPVLAQPLQLMLPEVHRGLKAFGLASPAPVSPEHAASRSSPSRPAASLPSIASHALAGSPLSHAGA